MTTFADPALARLLQLASPVLPVGAYSYSQGLEAAVEAGMVTDSATAQRWIEDVLEYSVSAMEAPVLARILRAWRSGDDPAAARWNAFSSPAAKLRSCAPKPCRWVIRWRGCSPT